jgi:hypothetical protein
MGSDRRSCPIEAVAEEILDLVDVCLDIALARLPGGDPWDASPATN